MNSWLLHRVATSLLTIFLLISAVFFIVRLAPGDPLDQMITTETTATDRELIRENLGLNESLPRQYLNWIGGVVRGDFGTSLRQQRPVAEILSEAVPATLLLTVGGYLLHLVLAFGSALLTTSGRGRLTGPAVRILGLTLYSVPAFWLGLMLILLLSGKAGWFPAAGMYSPDAALMPWLERQLDLAHHLVLPAAALGLSSFMGTARYLEAGLEEALGQDYILAARSRGVPESSILMRHALRNALLPVITIVGLNLPTLVGGAVVVEVVFGWPGMGRISIDAIWARDYPVIMATSLIAGVAVTAGSFLADVGYRLADPRVRFGRSRSGA
jgi:peptide/nickel transport system permease protein